MSDECKYLNVAEDDIAYITLPGHPGKGTTNIVQKQISVRDVIDEYKGPDVYLDFDHKGLLIGMEVLG